MPFHRGIEALGTHVVYDSGKYRDLFERTLERLDYDRLLEEVAARRESGEMVGIGVAYFVEKSGLGPDDLVRIRLDKTGAVEIVTGVASVGQGRGDRVGADLRGDARHSDRAYRSHSWSNRSH